MASISLEIKGKRPKVVDPVIGFTAGSWDFVHAGHCLHFEYCRQRCDFLIVGLQSDPSLDRPEKNRPIMSLEERYTILDSNLWVDQIVVYSREWQLHELDQNLKYNIRFMGADHKGKKHHPIKGDVVYTPRNHNYSSSNLRAKIILEYKGEI